MRISDLIKMGFRNLFRRKARTALTIVGVVIGTISIIVMISVGVGMNRNFEKSVMENGNFNVIRIVSDGWMWDPETEEGKQIQQKIDEGVIETIKQIDHVKAVTPYRSTYVEMETNKATCGASLTVLDFGALNALGYPEVVSGVSPTAENKEVILFGSYIARDWYKKKSRDWTPMEVDVLKERIKLTRFYDYYYEPAEGKKAFSLPLTGKIGLLKDGTNYDYSMYIDINYYKKIMQEFAKTLKPTDRKNLLKEINKIGDVQVCVDNMNNIEEVQEAIKALGYETQCDMDYIRPMQETANMLELILGCIGGVSMLVSAISIANTMIMSIYERTKEIGVMKVLGCYVRDVKKLFLFEAGCIGFLGGVIGIGLSYLAAWAINKYGAPVFQKLMEGSYIMGGGEGNEFAYIPFWLPLIALAFAVLIGVVSGYYPARRATKISAIEAMKTEG